MLIPSLTITATVFFMHVKCCCFMMSNNNLWTYTSSDDQNLASVEKHSGASKILPVWPHFSANFIFNRPATDSDGGANKSQDTSEIVTPLLYINRNDILNEQLFDSCKSKWNMPNCQQNENKFYNTRKTEESSNEIKNCDINNNYSENEFNLNYAAKDNYNLHKTARLSNAWLRNCRREESKEPVDISKQSRSEDVLLANPGSQVSENLHSTLPENLQLKRRHLREECNDINLMSVENYSKEESANSVTKEQLQSNENKIRNSSIEFMNSERFQQQNNVVAESITTLPYNNINSTALEEQALQRTSLAYWKKYLNKFPPINMFKYTKQVSPSNHSDSKSRVFQNIRYNSSSAAMNRTALLESYGPFPFLQVCPLQSCTYPPPLPVLRNDQSFMFYSKQNEPVLDTPCVAGKHISLSRTHSRIIKKPQSIFDKLLKRIPIFVQKGLSTSPTTMKGTFLQQKTVSPNSQGISLSSLRLGRSPLNLIAKGINQGFQALQKHYKPSFSEQKVQQTEKAFAKTIEPATSEQPFTFTFKYDDINSTTYLPFCNVEYYHDGDVTSCETLTPNGATLLDDRMPLQTQKFLIYKAHNTRPHSQNISQYFVPGFNVTVENTIIVTNLTTVRSTPHKTRTTLVLSSSTEKDAHYNNSTVLHTMTIPKKQPSIVPKMQKLKEIVQINLDKLMKPIHILKQKNTVTKTE